MMPLETILHEVRAYAPALAIDKFVGQRGRVISLSIVQMMLAISIIVAFTHGILTRFEFTESYAFVKNLEAATEQIYGICSIVFSLYLVLFALNAFYNAHYFRGVRTPVSSDDDETTSAISYEAAGIFFAGNLNDMTRSLILSDSGSMILARAGIPAELSAKFIDGKRVLLAAAACRFNPTGLNGTLKLEDVARGILESDPDFMFFLTSHGVSKEAFLGAAAWVGRISRRAKEEKRWWSKEALGRIPSIGKDWAYGGAYVLRRHASEITGRYISLNEGKLVAEDTETLEGILAKSREANALIVGEDPGSADTVIYELARRISAGRVLPEIEHKRVFVFDGSAFAASTRNKAEFESEFVSLLKDAVFAGDIILVFQDFPAFLQSAHNLSSDALQLLESVLQRNDIQIVALATSAAFHRHLEREEIIKKYFERMLVKGKSDALYIELLEDEAIAIEFRQRLFFTYPAIAAIVESASRYFPDAAMPDKAIDLLFDITPSMKAKGRSVVRREDVLSIVKERTGIPAGEASAAEKDKLLNLESKLHERIVGQDVAVKAISGVLMRARSGINNPSRPMGSFLFLGPTGVGKTETVKALADIFFGSENTVIRLDMSEFRTADALERLIGDFESGTPGILTSKLREKPYGVLLLDEFEKTSENVLDLFLQILDEGIFSDMGGNKVNVRSMIIIATSNAGSDIIYETAIQKGTAPDESSLIQSIVDRHIFKPELLNRFDGVIVFHPLADGHLREIAKLMLGKLSKRLKERGINLIVTDELISILMKEGIDPAFGARPMNRAIQEKVEQIIAEKMIRGDISAGSSVELTAADFGSAAKI